MSDFLDFSMHTEINKVRHIKLLPSHSHGQCEHISENGCPGLTGGGSGMLIMRLAWCAVCWPQSPSQRECVQVNLQISIHIMQVSNVAGWCAHPLPSSPSLSLSLSFCPRMNIQHDMNDTKHVITYETI